MPTVIAALSPLLLVTITLPPLTVNTLFVALPAPSTRASTFVEALLAGMACHQTAFGFTLTCTLLAPLPTDRVAEAFWFVATLLKIFVPPFRFQLLFMVQLTLEANSILDASPLLFEVVSVPPAKVKTELETPPLTTLVASNVWTVMAPPAASVFVARFTSGPMFNVALGELIEPPFVTINVPALIVVLPV